MRTSKTRTSRTRRSNSVTESRRRVHMARARRHQKFCGGEKLSEKLRALKSLLPAAQAQAQAQAQNNQNGVIDGGGETEQLFQETADYIIQLRTQVLILQRLIQIYASSEDHHQKENVVL